MAERFFEVQTRRPVYPTEGQALRGRWTFNAGGRPDNLVHNGRPLIVDGRVIIADDVELQPSGSGAFLIVREEFDGHPKTIRFILNREKGRLRLGVEALVTNIGDRFSRLGSWVNRVTSIEDYMAY